jgi:hypothetical protein
MPKSCIVCSAVAATRLQIRHCDACQSAMYCSMACQRKDWKTQHKKICKLLNVGHGDMQVWTRAHTSLRSDIQDTFERNERDLSDGMKRFFTLFEESTFEGSRAAAQKMKKYAKRQTKQSQELLFFHSLSFLVRSSNSQRLSWPNSPLLVMLEVVDPNVLLRDEETPLTPLHHLAPLAAPSDYSTHVNQLILAKQLVDHGANVNAVCIQEGETPLHSACCTSVLTNLDFIELLLEAGADPNAQNHGGKTPLLYTYPHAPGAANFLLNWPTTDTNILPELRASFLAEVRFILTDISFKVALPDNPEQVQHKFLLQQWRDIEEMLVERGASPCYRDHSD